MFVTPILLLASLCLSIHALHDVEWRNANGIGHLGQNANELEFDQSEKKGQRNDNGFGHSSHRHEEHPFVPVEEHRGHGPHPHRHCPPPPFLRRLRGQERAGYFRIVGARNASRKEILARLDQWASSIGIQAEYENYTVEAQKRALHFHDIVVGNLSGKALELFNKLWSIRQDESLTRLAACRQIVAVVKTVGKRRQQLLRRLVPIPPPLIWGPPPRGCLPPRPPRSSSSSGSGSAEDRHIGPMPKIEAREADVSESANEPMPKEQRVPPPLPSHALFILDANSDESAEINERIRQGAFHKQMSAPLLKRKANEPEKRILARESDDSKSESREEEYPAVGHRGHDTPIHPSIQRNGGKVRHGGRNNRESSSSSSESAEYRRQNRRQLAEKSSVVVVVDFIKW